ncbi:hypothetical protein SAMN00017405_2118 [Desulfonispora thiosulfatigenes DSM 11270]|uniref:Uncharacterized protein n=1 Tax=Desulfonispora thiosulfatigenes DSM 11270 TaxID=656914 RepID=A0A1W1VHS4_DESTI|nr:hypothetical protein SAMN00017405_2118 [Desulfonispora thiosulfatigenes DSM 11270]
MHEKFLFISKIIIKIKHLTIILLIDKIINVIYAEVAEWQTQRIQNPPGATS